MNQDSVVGESAAENRNRLHLSRFGSRLPTSSSSNLGSVHSSTASAAVVTVGSSLVINDANCLVQFNLKPGARASSISSTSFESSTSASDLVELELTKTQVNNILDVLNTIQKQFDVVTASN